MAAPIFFNVPGALDYLLKNGFVYTARAHSDKNHINRLRTIRKGSYYNFTTHGNVFVSFIRECNSYDIEEYVEHSGFDSLEEWRTTLTRIHGIIPTMDLLKAELVQKPNTKKE